MRFVKILGVPWALVSLCGLFCCKLFIYLWRLPYSLKLRLFLVGGNARFMDAEDKDSGDDAAKKGVVKSVLANV